MNSKSKNISRRLKTLYILLACWIAFIWIHSMIPAEASSEESQFVGRLIRPILEIFIGQGAVTDFIVRKLAHFSEYAILGMLLCGILLTRLSMAASVSTATESAKIITSTDADVSDSKSLCSGERNRTFAMRAVTSWYHWSYILLLVLAVAVVDESIQLITPGRSSQVTDVLIDTSGGLTGIVVLRILSYMLLAALGKKGT